MGNSWNDFKAISNSLSSGKSFEFRGSRANTFAHQNDHDIVLHVCGCIDEFVQASVRLDIALIENNAYVRMEAKILPQSVTSCGYLIRRYVTNQRYSCNLIAVVHLFYNRR